MYYSAKEWIDDIYECVSQLVLQLVGSKWMIASATMLTILFGMGIGYIEIKIKTHQKYTVVEDSHIWQEVEKTLDSLRQETRRRLGGNVVPLNLK